MQPMTTLAALELDLERARAEYAARSGNVGQALEAIRKRIAESRESAPRELESRYALVEGSLCTLQGRLLGHSDRGASLQAFHRALELFEKNKQEFAQHTSSTRFWTDWGIALYRIGRNEEAREILSKICSDGIAPAEAFGYLGYSEWTRGDLAAAQTALRKGLEIAPTNLTMSFYFARVLADAARNIAAKQEPEKSAAALKDAAEAYCRAGEIARNLGDFSSAGRDGVRALNLDPENERALYLTADSYRLLRREKVALLIVERFLIQQPMHPGALGIKGVLLRDLGNAKESVEILRSIPSGSADLAWIQAQLAISLSTEDAINIEEALDSARRAVALDPIDPFIQRVLGFLEFDHKEYDAAASTLSKAKELGETSEELIEYLGRALIFTGKYEQAVKELSILVAANPSSAVAHALLGLCAESLKNPERALLHYRRASRLAPEEPDIFVNLMDLLNKEDLRPQAMDEIEGRLNGPLRYLALWYRAKFESADNDWQSARQTYQEALQAAKEQHAEEDIPGILVDYGDVLREEDDYENAREVYFRAYEIDSSRHDVLFGKALYHCDVAEFEEGRACLEVALDAGTNTQSQAPLWDLMGWCLQHLGNADDAVKAYQKAFELSDQKDPWFHKGLANALMNFDQAKAKEHFESILKEQKYQVDLEPAAERPSGNESNVGLLGWCNYRLGRYDEAIRLFEATLDRPSENPSLQFDLALVFLASGRVRLASDAYELGHKMTARCAKLRQRGLYYIALFDLADARRQHVLLANSDAIFQAVQQWLTSAGVAVEGLPWLVSIADSERRPAKTQ